MDEADPRAKLEPFQAPIGEWTIESLYYPGPLGSPPGGPGL
jgi:hypothetical protein